MHRDTTEYFTTRVRMEAGFRCSDTSNNQRVERAKINF